MIFRTTSRYSLVLAALFVACNGRVVVGTEQGAAGGGGELVTTTGGASSGGTGGLAGGPSSSGGRGGEGGDVSKAGGSGGNPTQGGAAGSADAGSAGEAEEEVGPRWMLVVGESQSELDPGSVNFQDVAAPSSRLVTVDDRVQSGGSFSPDGHFAYWMRSVDVDTVEVFVIDTWAPELGTPRSLGRLGGGFGCTWSPDSKKLICVDGATSVPEVVAFTPIGGTPPARLGSTLGTLVWTSDGALFFTSGSGEFVRVAWTGDGNPELVRSGFSGVLTQVAADGSKATFAPWDAATADEVEILDLVTLDHAPLTVRGTISPSFRWLVRVESDPMFDVPSKLSYFALDGLEPRLVDTRELRLSSDDKAHTSVWMKFAGAHFVELNAGRLVLTHLGVDAVSAEEVPGDYRDITSLEVSADGRSIAFRAIDRTSSDLLPTSHWLVRVGDAGVESVTKLGRFPALTGASFSPDSAKLLLSNPDRAEQSLEAEAPILFVLEASGSVKRHDLDLPHDFSSSGWSSDSAYFGVLGGTGPTNQSLYVVHALDLSKPPREILSCGAGASPEQECPSVFMFQR